MYVRSDMFLTDKASVEVSRDPERNTSTSDVFIRISDVNGSFEVVGYMTYAEAQALVGTYQSLSTHSTLSFDGTRVYAPKGGLIDELKFTLEMM